MFSEPGQLHVHFSVPFYSGDQLIRSLRPLSPALAQENISVPDPEKYRSLFKDKMDGKDTGIFLPMEIERLTQDLNTSADMLILSFNEYFGLQNRIFDHGRVYHDAPQKIEFLREIFPNREISLFFSAANPGSIMCAMMNTGKFTIEQSRRSLSLRPLWSDLVDRIDDMHPDLPITLWATEDTPVTWPVVLRKVLRKRSPTFIPGCLSITLALVSKAGQISIQKKLKSNPRMSERDLMVLLNEALSNFGREKDRSFDVNITGWTQEIIDDFELLYEQDIDSCADWEQVDIITLETELIDRFT